jgi:hypothetical protein
LETAYLLYGHPLTDDDAMDSDLDASNSKSSKHFQSLEGEGGEVGP